MASHDIEDEEVALADGLFVEGVGDGATVGSMVGSTFMARDGTGILGRLALRVIEVRGYGDDRVVHASTVSFILSRTIDEI